MFKFYFAFFISIVLSACGLHLNYLGTTSAPTENVDIYVDAGSIKKSYTIVGKGYMEGATLTKRGYDKMQKKALKMAKEKGADAILFHDAYYTESSSTYNSNCVVNSRPEVLFLKYE